MAAFSKYRTMDTVAMIAVIIVIVRKAIVGENQ